MSSFCCCLHVEIPEETTDESTDGGCRCPGCFLNKFFRKFENRTRDERTSNEAAILDSNIAAPNNAQNESITTHSITLSFDPNQSVEDQLQKVAEQEITREVEADQKSDDGNPESLNIPSQKRSDARDSNNYTSADDEDECPTCLEEYESENPKILTECNHHFHLGCIYEWMERCETCPICSKVMVFSDRSLN